MADPLETIARLIGRSAGRPERTRKTVSAAPLKGIAAPPHIRWLRLAAGLLALSAFACATGARHLASTGEVSNSPLLWRAEAPGAVGGTLYLLGSVHLGTPAMHDLGPVVTDAYERSQELVVEVDLSKLDPGAAALMMARYGSLEGGRRLGDVVSAENHALLIEYLEARGIPPGPFESLEPWLISTMVTLMEFEDAGLEGRLGIDQAFIERAGGAKPIVPLETVEFQLSMLSDLDWETQDLMLGDTLRKSGEMQVTSEKIVESWRLGDEVGLEQVLFQDLEDSPALKPLYQVMFYDRNQRMTERLIELAADGMSRFVVLGAGHMVGSHGIPALLAAEGFRVDQIGGR